MGGIGRVHMRYPLHSMIQRCSLKLEIILHDSILGSVLVASASSLLLSTYLWRRGLRSGRA